MNPSAPSPEGTEPVAATTASDRAADEALRGVFGDRRAWVLELTRADLAEFTLDSLGQLSAPLLHKFGVLAGARLAYLSDDERRRARERVLEQMLDNKRALIDLLQKKLERAAAEDERERVSQRTCLTRSEVTIAWP